MDDDKTLVSKCLNGHKDSFGLLVDKYQKVIFNAVFRMVGDYDDAQEVAQIAFVRAYEKLDDYNSENKFFSWLYRIAINGAINHLKRRKKHTEIPVELASTDFDPDQNLEKKEIGKLVQSALDELNVNDRTIIVLKHFCDLSMKDVAALFEIPVKTVKSRLYTARMRLYEILKEKGAYSRD